MDAEEAAGAAPFEFENWAVIALGGNPNKVQVGDMGLDGRIFPVGTKPTGPTGEGGLYAEDWFPIQVKQVDKVGRPDIDKFEAVMEREGPSGGAGGSGGSSSPSTTRRMRRRMCRVLQADGADHQAADGAGDSG